jgi:hypothetical protein
MLTVLIASDAGFDEVRALGSRWQHRCTPTIDGCAPATLHHILGRSSRAADPRGVVASPVLASESGTRSAQAVGSVG